MARHNHEFSICGPFNRLNGNNLVLDIKASRTINILLSSDHIEPQVAILTNRKERLMLEFLYLSLTKRPCSNTVRINLRTESLLKRYYVLIAEFLIG